MYITKYGKGNIKKSEKMTFVPSLIVHLFQLLDNIHFISFFFFLCIGGPELKGTQIQCWLMNYETPPRHFLSG